MVGNQFWVRLLAGARWVVWVQAHTSKQYHSIFCWRSVTISASFLVKTPKWNLFVQKHSMYGLKNHLGKQVAQINPHRYSFKDPILVKIFFLAGVCCFYYLCWLCFWKSRYVHFYFYFYFRLNTSYILMKILQPLEAFPAATILYRVAIFRLYAGLWTIYDHYTLRSLITFFSGE